jgi:hypothetical protein
MKRPSTQPVIDVPLPSAADSVDTATLELLAAWKEEDATSDPEEVRAADEEISQFMKIMNQSRAEKGERLLFP